MCVRPWATEAPESLHGSERWLRPGSPGKGPGEGWWGGKDPRNGGLEVGLKESRILEFLQSHDEI